MSAQYYALHGGVNIARAIGADYAYLDKQTGKFVSHNSLFNAITGAGGDSDTYEITSEQAQAWVAENRPGLSVDWGDA